MVQKQTFKYFWNFAHAKSGMALERSNPKAFGGESLNIVTTGGSGFGVMAIIVGIKRNFISRVQALDRLLKITEFLLNSDRFHGAFPHWYYGDSGKVKPFFTKDNGGDIVETSFMIQGLLKARQYFNNNSDKEINLRKNINTFWNEVEWKWYTNNKEVLIWHWSPNFDFSIKHEIRGYGTKSCGLTASDNQNGYAAHSPTNDLGVISPTAALSSFPYTPEFSMQALRHFYYYFEGKLWGEYGFNDAFNETENWYSKNYLAIDQGPIIVMIENYRTGLLWNLFMSCPEVQEGFLKLNFSSTHFN